jgi:hypothetical protein
MQVVVTYFKVPLPRSLSTVDLLASAEILPRLGQLSRQVHLKAVHQAD